MYILLNLSHCVKSYGHFCQILSLFTMPTYQIWSCHVPQDANFENFLFCLNSTFNIRKSHKISSGKALYFRSYQPKTSPGGGGGGGMENTPSGFRAKMYFFSSKMIPLELQSKILGLVQIGRQKRWQVRAMEICGNLLPWEIKAGS